jgi:hypothetical protein
LEDSSVCGPVVRHMRNTTNPSKATNGLQRGGTETVLINDKCGARGARSDDHLAVPPQKRLRDAVITRHSKGETAPVSGAKGLETNAEGYQREPKGAVRDHSLTGPASRRQPRRADRASLDPTSPNQPPRNRCPGETQEPYRQDLWNSSRLSSPE